jgi:pentapeptide MXKDX repeat protein
MAMFITIDHVLRRDPTMKTRSRLLLTLSAMSVGFALAFAPAAFAQQDKGAPPMTKDDGMKKGDAMKKDDGMKKGDGMKKDEMKK